MVDVWIILRDFEAILSDFAVILSAHWTGPTRAVTPNIVRDVSGRPQTSPAAPGGSPEPY
eukprot:5133384-Prymnesium_polylepis.1